MRLKKTLLSVALLSATSAMAYETGKTYRFTVLHTNDIHGHFWQSDKGEYGLAAQKHWLIIFAKRSQKKVVRY